MAVSPPVDGNGDGRAQITRRLTGEVDAARQRRARRGPAGAPYTLRDEEAFQALRPDGTVRPVAEEYGQLIELGVDGFFTNSPDTGRVLVDILQRAGAAASRWSWTSSAKR